MDLEEIQEEMELDIIDGWEEGFYLGYYGIIE